MDALRLIYRPPDLRYSEFARCNALCFADEPLSEPQFERLVMADFWGAYVADTLVGYGILSLSGQARRIRRLAICPEQQGRGYGKRLLAAMLAHGRCSGCESFTLSVQQDNRVALHLYERAGFKVVSESHQYLVDIEALAREAMGRRHTSPYSVVPIVTCNPVSLPERMEQWVGLHRYPSDQVLLFRERKVGYVGFCRLNPAYPGCAPFEVWREDVRLHELLATLYDRLLPGKTRIRLTFSDDKLAQALARAGHSLNYRLYEMSLALRDDTQADRSA